MKAISGDEGFETIEFSQKEFMAATQLLSGKVRPLLDDSMLAWPHLDRNFILEVLEGARLMSAITPDSPQDDTIQVHAIGRTPEFDDPHEFDEWMFSGGKTYKVESWRIGEDVSVDQVKQFRDYETGDLYIFSKIVDDKWKDYFVSRKKFQELKVFEDSK